MDFNNTNYWFIAVIMLSGNSDKIHGEYKSFRRIQGNAIGHIPSEQILQDRCFLCLPDYPENWCGISFGNVCPGLLNVCMDTYGNRSRIWMRFRPAGCSS
jgi:hypothetical protein